MRAHSAIAAMLCLAFALSLAACGGGGKPAPVATKEFWDWDRSSAISYYKPEGGSVQEYSCRTLIGEPGEYDKQARSIPVQKTEGAKAGDILCYSLHYSSLYSKTMVLQTRESEFRVNHYVERSTDNPIHLGIVEKFILLVASVYGIAEGYKYGVFDNTEEHTTKQEDRVEGERTTVTGRESGMATSIYNSTYGVRFGDATSTTKVERKAGRVSLQRSHTIRYYKDKPNSDSWFDLYLTLKSVNDGLNVEVVGRDFKPTADHYCSWPPPVKCE